MNNLSAKEAKDLVNKVKFMKVITADVGKYTDLIYNAANEGKTNIVVSGDMTDSQWIKLNNLGYSLSKIPSDTETYEIIISWS